MHKLDTIGNLSTRVPGASLSSTPSPLAPYAAAQQRHHTWTLSTSSFLPMSSTMQPAPVEASTTAATRKSKHRKHHKSSNRVRQLESIRLMPEPTTGQPMFASVQNRGGTFQDYVNANQSAYQPYGSGVMADAAAASGMMGHGVPQPGLNSMVYSVGGPAHIVYDIYDVEDLVPAPQPEMWQNIAFFYRSCE